MTEVECGQLSSCSDSDDNSSAEDGGDNLGDSCGCVSGDAATNSQTVTGSNTGLQSTPNAEEEQSIEDVEAENDVDEMSGGDNDVFNQPSLLSEFDSLTEPSLESLTRAPHLSATVMTSSSSVAPAATATATNPTNVGALSALEDEMLLSMLMDLQQQSSSAKANQGSLPLACGATVAAPTASTTASGRSSKVTDPQKSLMTAHHQAALIDSLQLDLGGAAGLSKILQKHKVS